VSAETIEIETLQVSTDDDTHLATYRWPAEGHARAILIIVHGMAEHACRYDRFARHMAAAGIDVHAFDLRGHGVTAPAVDHGYIGTADDWQALVDDVARIRTHALDTVGRRPVFVFGHSLGSFIAQAVLQERGDGYAGAVLSGTDQPSRLGCRLAAGLAALESARVDATGRSALLQRLSMGAYNRRLKRRTGHVHTPFDWLSSDRRAVADYNNDSACGFAMRADTWRQLLHGIARTCSPHARRAMPPHLPVLIVAGCEDSMGHFGRGPRSLARALDNDGQRDVDLRLYADARHELLHDHTAERVNSDVLAWVENHIDTPEPPPAATRSEPS